MGWHLDGRVSAVIGTHTHVQTADARVLPRGTAYISDAGMCGPRDSVIGVKKELVLERFPHPDACPVRGRVRRRVARGGRSRDRPEGRAGRIETVPGGHDGLIGHAEPLPDMLRVLQFVDHGDRVVRHGDVTLPVLVDEDLISP